MMVSTMKPTLMIAVTTTLKLILNEMNNAQYSEEENVYSDETD